MEYKDFENQLQSDVIAQLKEIDAFDIIEDEQRVTVIDSCDEAVFAGYISEDPVNASVVSNGMVIV